MTSLSNHNSKTVSGIHSNDLLTVGEEDNIGGISGSNENDSNLFTDEVDAEFSDGAYTDGIEDDSSDDEQSDEIDEEFSYDGISENLYTDEVDDNFTENAFSDNDNDDHGEHTHSHEGPLGGNISMGDDVDDNEDKDLREEDIREEKSVQTFLTKGCGCNLNCSEIFDAQGLIEIRSQALELSTNDKDLFIKGVLRSQMAKVPGTKQHRTYFHYHGRKICKKMFLVMNAISQKFFSRVCSDYVSAGLTPHRHGSTKKLPHNALTFAEIKRFKVFMDNYASCKAVSLPGPHPGQKSLDRILLPTDETRVRVWRFYVKCCKTENIRYMSYKTFLKKMERVDS